MPLVCFDLNETREYILKQEQEKLAQNPSYQPTVFKLGILDTALSTELMDSMTAFQRNDKSPDDDGTITVHYAKRRMQVVRFGVKGWTNLVDKQGNPVEPKFKNHQVAKGLQRMGLTDESLNVIKPWIKELAGKIESDNSFLENDEKNSDTPSKDS